MCCCKVQKYLRKTLLVKFLFTMDDVHALDQANLLQYFSD